MPFGAHETMEVHEILSEKMNLINHFSLYTQMTQNSEIQAMLQRHMQTAISAYNQLVAYTHDFQAANQQMPMYSNFTTQAGPEQIQYGLHQPASIMPENAARFNDNQIMNAVLSCHKTSAKQHLQASLECADPNVRQMLMQGALLCADQAYEVFLLMNRQGTYQVPTMNDHTAKTFLHRYQPVGNQMMGNMGVQARQ